jgi:D-alanyl-lipoteichoic acid acyltransferase DltB (MBOAT superfamily)
MTGLIFLLHFGTFHLLSCAWRAAGVDAKPLMNWPLLSASVGEFWGRRWNTAFRDLTHRFLFRPLLGWFGPRAGVAAGFLFSGVVHDLVISVPAGGGYGWPTLYFALQGLGLLAERSRFGKSLGLGGGWKGRAFTAGVVAGPACGLFHPPFVLGVVLPFLAAVGAG